MQLFRTLQLSFALLATLAKAQNPFTFTTTPVVKAGTPFNITWAPSTGTVVPVDLILRQGDAMTLKDVLYIATAIQNTGYYIWTPPSTLQKAPNYAFEIRNGENQYLVNYSEVFAIDSPSTSPNSMVSSDSVTSSISAGGATVTSAASRTAVVVTTTDSKGVTTTISITAMSTGSATTTAAQTQSTNAAGGRDKLVGNGLALGIVGALMAAL